jgi:DegV family protein with EDD domain
MIEILTDSCSDLSAALLKQFHIRQIPFVVTIGEDSYLDGKTITTPGLFKKVEASGALPKTAAPSPADFATFFNTPNEIIYIGISSQLSAGHQVATKTAESLDPARIHVIDSHNLSTGIALSVLTACDLRDQGCTAQEIIDSVESFKERVYTTFVIDKLDYLYKGGRCSAMEHVVGSILNIHPVIAVDAQAGTMDVKEKISGSRKKALNSMLQDFENHLPDIDLKRVFVTHTGCDADADFIKSRLLDITPIEQVYITTAGCTIASHAGPDTIGILYALKSQHSAG